MDKSETGHGTEVVPADVEGWRNLSYRWAASESAAQELKREEKIDRLPAVGNSCGANVWAVASETYAEPSGKHAFCKVGLPAHNEVAPQRAQITGCFLVIATSTYSLCLLALPAADGPVGGPRHQYLGGRRCTS